jgi:hypothetical protein
MKMAVQKQVFLNTYTASFVAATTILLAAMSVFADRLTNQLSYQLHILILIILYWRNLIY